MTTTVTNPEDVRYEVEEDPSPGLDVPPIYPGLVFADEQTRLARETRPEPEPEPELIIGADCPPPTLET